MPSYKYPLLNDKDWLYDLYITQQQSTITIAELAGAKTGNSARQALGRFGIQVRNNREGAILNQVDDIIVDKDFIDGSLLGDACLLLSNKTSKICEPSYSRGQKYYEYVNWCGQQISQSSCKKIRKQITKINYKGQLRYYESYTYMTMTSSLLRPFYNRWYPESNGFKKIVPRDINFTPKTFLVWFMDDGCSMYRDMYHKGKTPLNERKGKALIKFSSESFSEEDNQFLCDGFNNVFDLQMKVIPYSAGTGYKIRILQSKSIDFFNIIGPPPVECYKYKWKFGKDF